MYLMFRPSKRQDDVALFVESRDKDVAALKVIYLALSKLTPLLS